MSAHCEFRAERHAILGIPPDPPPELLERLNTLNVEVNEALRRVLPLQTYLVNVNNRQGLGIKIFDTVVDKKKFYRLASAAFTASGTPR